MSSDENDASFSDESSDEDIWEPDSSDSDSDIENLSDFTSPRDRGNAVPKGYNDVDEGPPAPTPKFRPAREPGVHLNDEILTKAGVRKFLHPSDFFKLYFTVDLVNMLVLYTNKYAAHFGPTKPTVYKGWYDVTVDEFYTFLGLLMYMSIVRAPSVSKYWSRSSLYNGLWARSFMTKKRFLQIMSFLKVSNFETEDRQDKLSKIRFLYEYIHKKCQKLYQPHQNLSIDERMVQNKGRYGFRQYIRDKPTKWGMKIWVLADSLTGYTYDFEIYVGKDNSPSSRFGLAYDVVMRLSKSIINQGYVIFFDNFYTSYQLLKDLLLKGICACGTILKNRKGFPNALKDVKTFEKNSNRGDMRWVRDDEILTTQWRDNKTVSVMSNFMTANGYSFVKRRTKINGEYRELLVKQPSIIKEYNVYMGGVDKSDQLINKYNVLRKTKKYWKTLFFHFIDIARVNSYILFQEWRKTHSDIPELKRPNRYLQLDFTEELTRELGKIEKYQSVPTASNVKQSKKTTHSIIPEFSQTRRNCKLCYQTLGVERKVSTKCGECDTYLCFHGKSNCLLKYHQS
ncbi:piggyBac transposable element-derived protein 3-like isoform X1 [Biomphalaria glabrata]|uniref:PiggyBac transposable element-derived protein 3-like isoform X1 n=1 Tax=Biomphalaria glabrata TaxID=6526 RepID=A0A9W3AMV9_BIOGL|nr:piggyBac transposable element-derived protein 3-like isoform X1 [Biomphalaria glabrata]